MQHYRPKKRRLSDINRKNVNLHKCITKVENAPSEYTMISADGNSDMSTIINRSFSIVLLSFFTILFPIFSFRLCQSQRWCLKVLGKRRLCRIMAGNSSWGYGINSTSKYWTSSRRWSPKASSFGQIRNLLSTKPEWRSECLIEEGSVKVKPRTSNLCCGS